MIALGVGFASRCTATELGALVAEVMAGTGASMDGAVLAVPERKRGAVIVEPVAARYALALVFISDAALRARQGEGLTVSLPAQMAVGLHTVAEAAALAAAGPDARLLVPRRTRGLATCAAARGDGRRHEQEDA